MGPGRDCTLRSNASWVIVMWGLLNGQTETHLKNIAFSLFHRWAVSIGLEQKPTYNEQVLFIFLLVVSETQSECDRVGFHRSCCVLYYCITVII